MILENRIGIIVRVLLAKGGHNFLVLSSFGCLVDPFFPGKPFLLIGVFQSPDNFDVPYVDRVFRFDAEDFRLLSHGSPALEPFIVYEPPFEGPYELPLRARVGMLIALDEALGFGFDTNKVLTARMALGVRF